MSIMSKQSTVRKTLFQLMCCMILPLVFMVTALMSDISIKPDSFGKWIFPISVFGLFAVLLTAYLITVFKDRKNENNTPKKIEIEKLDIIFILLLIVITVSLRIPMYGTFQRWDAGEYFYRTGVACSEFDFSFDKFINGFKICNHFNYGFSVISGICMFISLYSYRVINVVQITFSVLAILCLYSIFKSTWKLSKGKAFASSLMISMIPVYLGLSTYMTPDYMMFIYFIFALYFQSKGCHVLEAFMMIMMVFCKESATVIVAGYYGFGILFVFFRTKNGLISKIKAVLRSRELWVSLISGVLFLVIYFTSSSNWTRDAGNTTRAFLFSRVYLIIRIKQMFFTHFSSIMTLVIIISFIIIFFRLFKKLKGNDIFDENYMKSLLGLSGAMTFVCATAIIYHIAVSARYDTFFVCCLGIFMIIFMNIIVSHYKNKKVNVIFYLVTSVLTILFMTESFINIDPLARHWFKQLDLGTGHTIGYESELEDYMGDSLVYNYQYAWLDKAIDEVMRDTDYDGEKGVYVPYSHVGPGTSVQLDGNGRFIRVCWDDEKKERGYYLPDAEYTPVNALYIDDYASYFPYKDLFYDEYLDQSTLKNEGVYTSVPYYADLDDYLDRIEYYFYHGEKKNVYKGLGTLPYYEIYKKDSYNGATSVDEIINKDIDPTNYVTEKDIDVAHSIISGDYAPFYEKVDELYNYKLGMKAELVQIGVTDRTDIHPFDGIEADFVLTDENGNEILRKERMKVTVGGYGLIEEVDNALLEMSIDESRTVEYTVPDKTLGLEKYAGQKVYIDIYVQNIVCIFEDQLNDRQKEMLYEEAFNYVWNYYKEILVSEIINKESLEYENGETSAISSEDLSSVESYMTYYMSEHGFEEEKFLSDYAHLSASDYEKAKVILANSSSELDDLYAILEESYKKCLLY